MPVMADEGTRHEVVGAEVQWVAVGVADADVAIRRQDQPGDTLGLPVHADLHHLVVEEPVGRMALGDETVVVGRQDAGVKVGVCEGDVQDFTAVWVSGPYGRTPKNKDHG